MKIKGGLKMVITKQSDELTKAIEIAEYIVLDVLNKYVKELPKIEYVINQNKSNFGTANTKTNIITISEYLFKNHSYNELVNTLVHEIFHILTPNQGHKGRWRFYASLYNYSEHRKIYGFIERTGETSKEHKISEMINAPYLLQCNRCNKVTPRYKMTKLVKRPDLYHCNCGGRIERIR